MRCLCCDRTIQNARGETKRTRTCKRCRKRFPNLCKTLSHEREEISVQTLEQFEKRIT